VWHRRAELAHPDRHLRHARVAEDARRDGASQGLEEPTRRPGHHRGDHVNRGRVVGGVSEVVARRGGGGVEMDVEVHLERLGGAALGLVHPVGAEHAQAPKLYAVCLHVQRPYEPEPESESDPGTAPPLAVATAATRSLPCGPICLPTRRSVTAIAWEPPGRRWPQSR